MTYFKAIFYFLTLIIWSPSLFAAAGSQNFTLQLRQTDYLTGANASGQFDRYSNLLTNYRAYYQSDVFQVGSEVRLILPFTESTETHISVPNLYGSLMPWGDEGLEFTAGRKRFVWSRFDEQWGLGIWQPQLRWDYVNPEAQGLTGLFAHHESKKFRLLAYASPIFLPDQNPRFNIKDGQIESSNRWFRPPVSQLQIENGIDSIEYVVEKPSIEEVVVQDRWSYALSLAAGDIDDGIWALASYAEKPLNQLHLGIDPTQVLNISSGKFTPIVHPVVVYHKLATVEAGYSGVDTHSWLSVTWEKPEAPDIPAHWEQSELSKALYTSANLAHRLPGRLSRTKLTWSYLVRADEMAFNQRESVVEGQIDSSLQRFTFRNVGALQARSLWWATARSKFETVVRYLFSFEDNGEWLSFGLAYSPQKNWTWNLGFDLFGAPEETAAPSFFGYYQGNDRIQGGLTYVF